MHHRLFCLFSMGRYAITIEDIVTRSHRSPETIFVGPEIGRVLTG